MVSHSQRQHITCSSRDGHFWPPDHFHHVPPLLATNVQYIPIFCHQKHFKQYAQDPGIFSQSSPSKGSSSLLRTISSSIWFGACWVPDSLSSTSFFVTSAPSGNASLLSSSDRFCKISWDTEPSESPRDISFTAACICGWTGKGSGWGTRTRRGGEGNGDGITSEMGSEAGVVGRGFSTEDCSADWGCFSAVGGEGSEFSATGCIGTCFADGSTTCTFGKMWLSAPAGAGLTLFSGFATGLGWTVSDIAAGGACCWITIVLVPPAVTIGTIGIDVASSPPLLDFEGSP